MEGKLPPEVTLGGERIVYFVLVLTFHSVFPGNFL